MENDIMKLNNLIEKYEVYCIREIVASISIEKSYSKENKKKLAIMIKELEEVDPTT